MGGGLASKRNIRQPHWAHPRAFALIGLALIGLGLSGMPASAVSTAEAARKAHRSKVVPTSRAAPDITATIPKSSPKAPAPQTKPDDEALPPPFNLPNAPRSRMRACGEQWQAIKLTGRAGSETWRDFATKCLAGAAEPARTIP